MFFKLLNIFLFLIEMSIDFLRKESSFPNKNLLIKKYCLDNIDSISRETAIKSVFKPFLSEEDIEKNKNNEKYLKLKKHQNEFSYKLKNKQKEIKRLYKINNTIFSQIINQKPSDALMEFKKEIKQIFFGRNSLLSKKFGFFNKKRRSISENKLKEKIFTGNLDFLDLEDNINIKKINTIKKNYLLHSSNFEVGKKPSLTSSQRLLIPKINKFQSLINLGNSNSKTQKYSNEENNKQNVFNEKENSSTINPSKTYSSFFNRYMNTISKNTNKQFSSIKKIKSFNSKEELSRNNNLNIKSKTSNFSENINNYYSDFCYSSSNDSSQFRRGMKKKKKEIVSQIKEVSKPISKIENELFKIIDRSNRIKNKELRDKKEEKVRKDIEIITGFKVKFRKKPKTRQFLFESLKGERSRKKIKDITKVSDKLTKMTDEDALKYAESSTSNYKAINKFLLPKTKEYAKYNYNMIIRDNCFFNHEKIEKMMMALQQLKNKFDLE